MQRRNFIKAASLATGAVFIGLKAQENQSATVSTPSTENPEQDEKFWMSIRDQFKLQTAYTNLENGYFSPQPTPVLEFHQAREQYINQHTSWYMRREQMKSIEDKRLLLSRFLGCESEELAITRNTTEALNTLIMGYPWKKGDEVVIGNQDYGSMVAAFNQASKRFGIKVKVAQVPLHPLNDEEIVTAYLSLFTKKTKLVHITHLINLSGQVLPVAKIADAAHAKGVEVAVDSAHAVAHLNFMLPDLKADYVGASLHKWLCNPLGVGFLWIKKEKIPKIWPLMGDNDYPATDVRKFEHQGTRPVQSIEALEASIYFHHYTVGADLKEARLKFLMQYWVKKLEGIEGITINTPWKDPQRCGAIANVSKKGFTATELAKELYEKHQIFTVAIEHPAIQGVRITPHIFTSLQELDKLVDALKK